jgi:hypothetical protein
MGRKLIYIIGIIVALAAVGVGSFYGGTVYAAQQASSARTAFLNGRGGAGGTGGTGGGAGANGGGFGGGVAGTIKSINGSTVEISTAQNVTTVTLSPSTTVMQSVAATTADLQVGQTVTVRGQRDSTGNVAASSIQVVPAGATFGGNRNGAAATATP